MRRYLFVIGLAVITFSIFISLRTADAKSLVAELAANAVYKVNIIAYANCPKAENAQRIAVLADFVDDVQTGESFVDLDRRNKIFLVPGPVFRGLESTAC